MTAASDAAFPLVPMEVSALSRALEVTAAPDGGWPYFAGKTSRLEPSCWALLATAASATADARGWARHAAFLARCESDTHLLVEDPRQPPNLAFNGLAALLALERPDAIPAARTAGLLGALADARGVRAPRAAEFRQDNSLRGWPWIDATFSWVEPTSWCLLAVKKSPARSNAIAARISEAERLLVDRCCVSGGWNFGNSSVLGQDLRPYVATTAAALLALQDRPHEPAVARSLDYLERNAILERSGLALALSIICFRVFGLDVAPLESRLADHWERGRFFGNLHVTAAALYALSSGTYGPSAFRL